MPTYRTYVEYDAEANVWVTGASEIPGLVAESSEIEGLVRTVKELAPDLLRQNLYKHVQTKAGGTPQAPSVVEHEVVVIQRDGGVLRRMPTPITII